MDLNEFIVEIKKYNLEFDENKIKKLYDYMNLLISENEKYNLTSIKEPKDIILKHFVDSLSIGKDIEEANSIIDVGTGAGFPGIPLAIKYNNKQFCLLDSLNKRIGFLESVKEKLKLDNVTLICGRAEDFAGKAEIREHFDIATSRAVAPLNVLYEYLIPFVKVDGKCICMKGPNYKEELPEDSAVLEELGGKIEKVKSLDFYGLNRVIIIIKKENKTPEKYPRRAGIPSKKPLWK